MKKLRRRSLEINARRRSMARIMFYLNAAVWVFNGGVQVSKMIADSNTLTAALVSFFFLVNVLALIVAARIIDDQEKWVFITALAVTTVNTLLIFIGFPDIVDAISLLLNVIIFINLIPLKPYYYKEA
ncbi:MAG TPA: hypothetical protein PK152_20430 [Anaerolineales bacterium]|jgi:hypothetical protein|nr:hypothetical protein [Anaerolineae bacterium]HRJ57538.1 hypothetical protein [Anaerolineales bacterium]HRK91503.1 hypothetical protein [Anaerolineales bacterium]